MKITVCRFTVRILEERKMFHVVEHVNKRQCAYNVTMMRVRGTIVAVREGGRVCVCVCVCECVCVCVCVCVCSVNYAACKARAPYVICGLSGSTIFFHILS
jgi:hypothetical protein